MSERSVSPLGARNTQSSGKLCSAFRATDFHLTPGPAGHQAGTSGGPGLGEPGPALHQRLRARYSAVAIR